MGKMLKVTRKRKRKERSVRWIVRGTGFLVLFFTALIAVFAIHNTNLWNRLQYQICYQMLKQYAPLLASGSTVQSLYIEEDDTTMYDMQSESQLSYEQILAKKDPQETQAADASEENKDFSVDQTGSGNTQTGENGNPSVEAASASASAGENLVSLEKLNDLII